MSGLPTQIVPVLIAGGLAQQVDDLALEPGQGWVTMRNAIYDRAGVIRRRAGYFRLSNTAAGEGGALTLASVRSLHSYQGRLVAIGNPVTPDTPASFTYLASGSWRAHDLAAPAMMEREPVQRSSAYSIGNPQLSATSDYLVYSWISGDELFIKIIERSTGAVVRAALAGYDAALHRTVTCGNYVLFIYTTAARFGADGLHVLRLDPAAQSFSAPLTLTSQYPLCFDACREDDDSCLVVWAEDDAPAPNTKYTIARINALAPPTLATSTTRLSASYGTAPESIAVDRDSTDAWVAFSNANAGVRSIFLQAFTLAGLPFLGPSPAVLTADDSTRVRVSVGCSTAARGGWLVWCGSRTGESTPAERFGTFAWAFDSTGTLSDERRAYWTLPYTRPVVVNGGYYALLSDSDGTGTDSLGDANQNDGRGYALVRLDGPTSEEPQGPQYCGAVGLDEAFGVDHLTTSGTDEWPLPAIEPLGEAEALDEYAAPLLVPVVARSVDEALLGLDKAALDFRPTAEAFGLGVEAQRCLALGGAFAGWFDGQSIVEQGFHRPPHVVRSIIGGAGNIVGAGTNSNDWNAYTYLFVYEWLDEQGNWHRSEPSAPYTIGVVLADTNATLTLLVANLALTARGDGANEQRRFLRIAVYRTKANAPEVYYRVDDPTLATYTSERGQAYTEVNDGLSDTQLEAAGYGTIYTQGEILENTLAPPARALASWKNRLWVASGDDGKAIWFSKQFVRTEAPGFNPILQVRVDDSPDDVVALAPLGGSLLIFTSSRIYYLTGEPPNDTGQDNRIVGPELVSDATGCSDRRSVVTFPGGVLFLSDQGFHICTSPQAPPQFTGAAVKQLTRDYPICRSAVHDAKHSRVLWTLANDEGAGLIVVWDYLHNAWGTWEESSALLPQRPAAMVGGVHYYADVNGVMQQTEGLCYDDDVWFGWKVTAPWLRLAGIAGYQRVRHVQALIDRANGLGQLRIKLRHDEATSVTTTRDFGVAYGGITGQPRAMLDVHVAQQKCRSIQVEIEELEPTDPLADPIGLVGLGLEVGAKQGPSKAPSGNRK